MEFDYKYDWKIYSLVFLFLISCFLISPFSVTAQTGNETNQSESNVTINQTNLTRPYIDPEILKAFENQTWVRVLVRLVDNSNITVTGTKEQRRNLSRQRDEWFGPVIDNVLSNLSKDEFSLIGKLFDGFGGEITGEGFDELSIDERISAIYLDTMVSSANRNETLLNKEPQAFENKSDYIGLDNQSLYDDSEITKRLRYTSPVSLLGILIVFLLIIIIYILIKNRCKNVQKI